MRRTGSSIPKLVLAATSTALIFAFVQMALPQSAGRIDSIKPAAARVGEQVTITGNGFGALNVQITVGGKAAQILSANGQEATFIVPEGVAPGSTNVIATNPGGHSGIIDFLMLEGILLPGNPSARAIDALFTKLPVGVDGNQIENGILMTRIDVRLKRTATIFDVNSTLVAVNGGIVSMARGFPALTIAVPRQTTVQGLAALVRVLNLSPGISHAQLARKAGLMELTGPFSTDALAIDGHLLPGRFPAAWNTSSLIYASGSCRVPTVTVIVPDFFGSEPTEFRTEIPSFQAPEQTPQGLRGIEHLHGYLLAELIAANGQLVGTGTNPFNKCLDLRLVQTANMSSTESTIAIASNFPSTGKFIVNYSQGYDDSCFTETDDPQHPDDQCHPPTDSRLTVPLDRAYDSLDWKEMTKNSWANFLIAVSAGNDLDAPSAPIYPGMGDSRYTNKMSIAQLTDTLFGFVQDRTLWDPSIYAPNFDALTASAFEAAALQTETIAAGLDATIESNVLVVGSTTAPSASTLLTAPALPTTDSSITESSFSESGSDVKAVGENIFNEGHGSSQQHDGTSYSAPQVAGLASYLWLLSPALRNSPMSTTRQTIVANAWPGIGLVDAYASVLSLDAAVSDPTPADSPIRLAILDVNGDNKFDENDVAAYLNHFFFDSNGNAVTEPAKVDYSRYDLNGDGFTGGTKKARFDLDRSSSTQFGTSSYTTVMHSIENNLLEFNENSLTDLQILCYYSFTSLYNGSADERKHLLSQLPGDHRCVFSVSPQTVTLNSGQRQQFEAVGAPQAGVQWTSTCGTVDQAGLFTAGNTAGACTVRATSLADSGVFAEATANILAGSTGISLNYVRSDSSPNGFFCFSGPSQEPDQTVNSYWQKTPFGRTREILPPPNVGGFEEMRAADINSSLGLPLTLSSNCRTIPGRLNSTEVVQTWSGSGNSLTWTLYISAKNLFGTPVTGSAVAIIFARQAGTISFHPQSSWMKALDNQVGASGVIQVNGSTVSRCAFSSVQAGGGGTAFNTECTGSQQMHMIAGQNVLLIGIVDRGGEANGEAYTITFTPDP